MGCTLVRHTTSPDDISESCLSALGSQGSGLLVLQAKRYLSWSNKGGLVDTSPPQRTQVKAPKCWHLEILCVSGGSVIKAYLFLDQKVASNWQVMPKGSAIKAYWFLTQNVHNLLNPNLEIVWKSVKMWKSAYLSYIQVTDLDNKTVGHEHPRLHCVFLTNNNHIY